MAGSLNRATIIGHLGADVEVHRTQDGRSIANFRVATTESWRDKNSGERREKSEWHTVKIFNEGLAGVAEKYLRKGSKVFIEGQLQTRQWEKDGQKHYSTEIVLQGFNSQLILLDGKDNSDGGGRRNDRDDDRRGGDDYGSRSRGDDRRGNDRRDDRGGGRQQQSRGGGGSFHDDMSDDIPFAPEWRV